MRVKKSNGSYRYPKRSSSDDLQWMRYHRILTGHHPDTGKDMSPEERRIYNKVLHDS